jgi:hypothetical protein
MLTGLYYVDTKVNRTEDVQHFLNSLNNNL